jgi:hypothetical protein
VPDLTAKLVGIDYTGILKKRFAPGSGRVMKFCHSKMPLWTLQEVGRVLRGTLASVAKTISVPRMFSEHSLHRGYKLLRLDKPLTSFIHDSSKTARRHSTTEQWSGEHKGIEHRYRTGKNSDNWHTQRNRHAKMGTCVGIECLEDAGGALNGGRKDELTS